MFSTIPNVINCTLEVLSWNEDTVCNCTSTHINVVSNRLNTVGVGKKNMYFSYTYLGEKSIAKTELRRERIEPLSSFLCPWHVESHSLVTRTENEAEAQNVVTRTRDEGKSFKGEKCSGDNHLKREFPSLFNVFF